MPRQARILLLTAAALLSAAGPAGAADDGRPLSRAEILRLAVPPGFADPVVRATPEGLVVDVRNVSSHVLNVRVTAHERTGGRRHTYAPVFRRLAPGASKSVRMVAPPALQALIGARRTIRREVAAEVTNAESNAVRKVERRFGR